jgi:hypothetical protein
MIQDEILTILDNDGGCGCGDEECKEDEKKEEGEKTEENEEDETETKEE